MLYKSAYYKLTSKKPLAALKADQKQQKQSNC